jgi:hypothetical protein
MTTLVRSRPLAPWALLAALGVGVAVAAQTRTGGDLALYEKSYQYATSLGGPNLEKARAMSFAEKVSARGDGAEFLALYQKVYTYASSLGGLNLDKEAALKLADRIASRKDGAKVLEAHEKAYKYASGLSGLNLGKEEALTFAASKSGLATPEARPGPPAAAKIHPGKAESVKLLNDFGRALGEEREELDELARAIGRSRESDRAEFDRRLARIVGRLKAKVAEMERVSLAPAGR